MRGLNGAVSEVFFDPEKIDPALGDGKPDGDVLARYLPQLAGCKSRHQHVCAQLHLWQSATSVNIDR